METVENAPAGTVIQTGGNGPGPAATDPSAKKDDDKEPTKKKKSFWRKLIPFA